MKIFEQHRDAVQKNVRASVVIDIREVKEVLWTDIALALDEWEEKKERNATKPRAR